MSYGGLALRLGVFDLRPEEQTNRLQPTSVSLA